MKETRHKRQCSVGFHLYKFQKQAKLICRVRNQDNDYLEGDKGLEMGSWGFWGSGNVLFHDLSAGYSLDKN